MAEFTRFTPPSSGGRLKLAKMSSTGKVYVDYKNSDDLRRLLTPNGKILSRKRTGMNAGEQRMVSNAIKRARFMALLPYTSATM
jgi:small subunit ribosomal protein S18